MNPFKFISNINIDFNEIILRLILYLTSNELQDKLLVLKIVFLAIIAALLGLIIFTISRTHYLQWWFIQDVSQFLTRRPYGAKKINRQWNKILERLETGIESDYKLAIIEANDMLDASLKRLGFDGQTLEDKLKNLTSATLPNILQLFEIYRLRNNIVHDPDYRLALNEAKAALDVYAQAFRDLQILGE
ncbi:MAG: hypothetical protein HYV47_03665 [Candidatus Nealsonbacteria bacterium]|nr:hypothetical protein [Candidatus Nealsonbacteria bacterium]